mmetsp:Transcript_655/g.2524  ORF Transcript_655/g.2524 Transcript_655/m.2524 type:complete len:286 (+) Transcript_655:252-1109(+)
MLQLHSSVVTSKHSSSAPSTTTRDPSGSVATSRCMLCRLMSHRTSALEVSAGTCAVTTTSSPSCDHAYMCFMSWSTAPSSAGSVGSGSASCRFRESAALFTAPIARSCSCTSPTFCFFLMFSSNARLTHGAPLDTSARVKSCLSNRSSSSRIRAMNASPTMSVGAPHSFARPHARSFRGRPFEMPRSSTYRLMCSQSVALPPGKSATGWTICMRLAMSISESSMTLPLCSSSCFLKMAFCSALLPTVPEELRKCSFSVSSRHSISLPSGISMVSSSIAQDASAGM